MRHALRVRHLLPCVLLGATACLADTVSPAPAAIESTSGPSLIGDPGGCAFPYLSSGILQPINADNSSTFQIGRTIPVKIRLTDCVTADGINSAAPQISLIGVGPGGSSVNEIISSSAADAGTIMRSAGDGQYIFNLSTKRSQFNAGEDLTAGVYQLTISGFGQFEDVVVQFALHQ